MGVAGGPWTGGAAGAAAVSAARGVDGAVLPSLRQPPPCAQTAPRDPRHTHLFPHVHIPRAALHPSPDPTHPCLSVPSHTCTHTAPQFSEGGVLIHHTVGLSFSPFSFGSFCFVKFEASAGLRLFVFLINWP